MERLKKDISGRKLKFTLYLILKITMSEIFSGRCYGKKFADFPLARC